MTYLCVNGSGPQNLDSVLSSDLNLNGRIRDEPTHRAVQTTGSIALRSSSDPLRYNILNFESSKKHQVIRLPIIEYPSMLHTSIIYSIPVLIEFK